MIEWIDKHIDRVKKTLEFGKFFDSIIIEEGIGDFFLFNPQLGIDVVLRNNFTIRSIHLYSNNHPGVRQFTNEIPFDLSFSMTRQSLRSKFGSPESSGGGGKSLLYESVPNWDKYQIKDLNVFLHIQYKESDNGIDLITFESTT